LKELISQIAILALTFMLILYLLNVAGTNIVISNNTANIGTFETIE